MALLGSRGGGCTLVIMAKAPKPGLVKTRLAQSLPLAAVVELYRCLLDDTVALAQSLDDVDVAIMCPASDVEDLSRAVNNSIPVVAQSGDGPCGGAYVGVCTFRGGWPQSRRRVQ